MEPRRVKPRVAIVYTSHAQATSASYDFAHYFGACLYLAGYSSVKLVPFGSPPKKKTAEPLPARSAAISVVPYGEKKAVQVEHCDDFKMEADIAIVKECQLVLVCVNPPDTEACGTKLASLLPKNKNIGIFSFQYGVKNFVALEPCFEDSGNIMFDGAVGLHVVRLPQTNALCCLAGGSLVAERLSREKVDWGTKYLNLLESSMVPILFRKVLTPFTWGTLVHDTVLATNALTGGSLQSHLRVRKNRLVYAQMIRESLQAFTAASKGGKWEPDGAAAGPFSLKMLELALCLPTFIFVPLTYVLVSHAPGAGSPMQADLHARRSTSFGWSISELCDVGRKHSVPMPAVKSVRTLLKDAIDSGNGVPSISPDELYSKAGSPTRSTQDLITKVLWWSGGTTLLVVFFILLEVAVPRRGL